MKVLHVKNQIYSTCHVVNPQNLSTKHTESSQDSPAHLDGDPQRLNTRQIASSKDFPAHLHAYNPIDEEEEKDEQRNVWQCLETLYEGPEESADALSFGQQLDQTHHTEQTEEVDGEEIRARL